MQLKAIPYNLSMWKNTLCSTFKLFTSKDLSYVAVGRIVKKGGFEAIRQYYKNLGPDFEKYLNQCH